MKEESNWDVNSKISNDRLLAGDERSSHKKGHHGLGSGRDFLLGIIPLLLNQRSGFEKVKEFEIVGVVHLGDGVTRHQLIHHG